MTETYYLLTGATGLLGGNLVKELIDRGHTVRALVLPNDPAGAQLPCGVEIIAGDLLDDGALERFFSIPGNCEMIVIHAAGIVTMDPNPSEKVRLVNVEGTRNIVEKCIRHHVRKLVYISSTSVIPELPHGQKISEVETFDPEQVTGYYAKTKAMATELVMQAVREHELNASVIFSKRHLRAERLQLRNDHELRKNGGGRQAACFHWRHIQFGRRKGSGCGDRGLR